MVTKTTASMAKYTREKRPFITGSLLSYTLFFHSKPSIRSIVTGCIPGTVIITEKHIIGKISQSLHRLIYKKKKVDPSLNLPSYNVPLLC